MHHFEYKNNELYVEDLPVRSIVEQVGSPVYIYSYATLQRHFEVFDKALGNYPHLICYSMKCNSNIAILRAFAKMGGGTDIVSRGELYRSLQAGVDPQKIVFSGVGKTEAEIAYALQSNILLFNVESEAELHSIQNVAQQLKIKAPVALRINPDVDPKTHPYISTGMKQSKFGIQFEKAWDVYQQCKKLDHIEVKGIDCHIGSQLTEVSPFVDALDRVLKLLDDLLNDGFKICYLDLGGGLGIRYQAETPPLPQEYAQAILAKLKNYQLTLIFEPGRVLMGNAGILVSRVIGNKTRDDKNFIIVDAAMNDLIRPAFYDSFHEIIPVVQQHRPNMTADIVGPICESGDFLAKDRATQAFIQNDLIAIMSAGAYGFSMSSNYNSRPRVTEVLVHGNQYEIIRKRETLEQLIENESIPKFLL